MRLPSTLTQAARWSRVAAVMVCSSFLAGCNLNFWRLDGHQSTIETAGPVAREQLHVFYVTCWVTLTIFVIVGSVLAYATIKFKARGDAGENTAPPEQSHGNPLIELSLIGASILALVIIAIPTLKAIWYTYDVPEAQRANTYEITATGSQWWFKFEYPNDKLANGNPLVTANELVIPAGRPVRINLRSADVIHSFWVPKLAGKVDMIPNRGNHIWVEADKPGYFWGQCAEYCGDSHALMRFRVIALDAEDFADWLAHEKAPARTVSAETASTGNDAKVQFASFKRNQYGFSDKWAADASVPPFDNWRQQQFPAKHEDPALIAQGRKLFSEKTCAGCHTIRGHEGLGLVGPDLTHVGSRTTIAAGVLENTPEQLARWISHPDQVKPGNKMYEDGYIPNNIHLTHEDVQALVAYLESLK